MVRAPELGNYPLFIATEDLNRDPERTAKNDPVTIISKEQAAKFDDVMDEDKWKNIGHTF